MSDTSSMRPGGSASIPASTDVSRLLGIGKAGAPFLLALFVLGNLTFMLTTLDRVASPWPCIIAALIVSAAAVPIIVPHSDPFPLAWSLGVLVAVAGSTALVSWQLASTGSPGREAWHFGANTWLLFFVTMRGRPVLGWVGFAVMLGITAWWAADVGRGPLAAAGLLETHAGILLVGTLFRGALRRASRRINSLNARSLELAAAAASSDAEQDIRRQRVAELAEVATPLLAKIARSSHVLPGERIEYLLAEATLRDSVRARSLHLPEIAAATAQARRRGVEVTLLDDRGGGLPNPVAMRRLTDRITESLRNVDRGRLTVRLTPVGRETAVSIVVESEGLTRRVDLDAEGQRIASAPGN
jgi:hypothetical protein